MKKYIFLIAVLVFCISCSKKQVSEIFIDASVEIAYHDLNGTDLLDPNNENSFQQSNIDVYEIVNGVKTKVYESNLDYPEHFLLYKNDDKGTYFLRLFGQGTITNGVSTSFINFGNGTEDRIYFELDEMSTGSIHCNKIWYNQTLVWDVSLAENGRYVYIVK